MSYLKKVLFALVMVSAFLSGSTRTLLIASAHAAEKDAGRAGNSGGSCG
jgi:hypothetical protein